MIDTETGEVIGDGTGEPEEVDSRSVNALRMLARTYHRSEQIDTLFAALSKAQSEFANAEKAGENPHFRSRYATLEAVLDATKQGRAANALAVIQMPVNWRDGAIAVTTLLGHASGQWIESTIAIPPMKLDAQGAGSVITYLRRYALMAILGIAAEDDDGEAASAKPGQTQSQRPGPQAAQNPNSLASQEQRKALWAAILRIHNGDTEHAKIWFDKERTQTLKPPVMTPQELTVGALRILMERVQQVERGEESQEPDDAGDEEFAADFQTEEEVREEKRGKKDKEKKK